MDIWTQCILDEIILEYKPSPEIEQWVRECVEKTGNAFDAPVLIQLYTEATKDKPCA
jgi:hypothetical protein